MKKSCYERLEKHCGNLAAPDSDPDIATRTKPPSGRRLRLTNGGAGTPLRAFRFAETLHAGSIAAPSAEQSLGELVTERDQPAIARATALSMLATYGPRLPLMRWFALESSEILRGRDVPWPEPSRTPILA